GFALEQRLAAGQAGEEVLNHRRVGVELGDVMADVFVARVPEHEKFRPVGPEYKAVRSDHAEPFGRVFDEVAQVSYASEQRLPGTHVPGNVHIFTRTSLQVRKIHRTFPFVRQKPDRGCQQYRTAPQSTSFWLPLGLLFELGERELSLAGIRSVHRSKERGLMITQLGRHCERSRRLGRY